MLSADRCKSLHCTDSYLSLDDILASQEKVGCQLRSPLYGLAESLDPGRVESDIPKGAKLEFPLWLVRALCTESRQTVRPQLPRHYRASWQKPMFAADASVVNLRRIGPYYYQVGVMLSSLPPLTVDQAVEDDSTTEDKENRSSAEDSSAAVPGLLEMALRGRLQKVLDGAQYATRENTPNLVSKLDEMEEALFRAGQERARQLRTWQTRRMVGRLESSVAATRLLKQRGLKRSAPD